LAAQAQTQDELRQKILDLMGQLELAELPDSGPPMPELRLTTKEE
jgi:hypothetical protein